MKGYQIGMLSILTVFSLMLLAVSVPNVFADTESTHDVSSFNKVNTENTNTENLYYGLRGGFRGRGFYRRGFYGGFAPRYRYGFGYRGYGLGCGLGSCGLGACGIGSCGLGSCGLGACGTYPTLY